ncbi:low-specificity L-threonine aldolase [Dictyobacter arantiisoli]|uniref:Threonine aldolase n=1 Tax=Dictyobacter arantiisoli TaxID=2014874 RepID=A0A5A5TK91_9CHLR|nr:low-specificity L-threonine aldolase [Dictyobacter arantiisoli]GCF11496.1 threonine aldolase [Dictyobacter arantiisoli]
MHIDLRSDTVTHPTQAMREAMYRAEVGDDVYYEDPTVNRLQDKTAQLTGKEAALFVPTGTMGNAIAVLTHAGRGQAVIVGDQSHIYHYEAGGPSTLGGSPMYAVPTHPNGMLDLDAVASGIADESDEHVAATALVCIENTHNRCGGKVLSVEQIEEITSLAHAHNIPVHMDGARIFNAAIALDVPISTLTRSVDSFMFCISKGLSAPIGSLLVGNKEFIRRATRIRKLLGGGMRQAGIIAAAGLVALDQMIDRLAEDHAHCKRLANGLAELPQLDVKADEVATNILIFTLLDKQQQPASDAEINRFLAKVQAQGVLLSRMGPKGIRAVTHYGIETQHIDSALSSIKRALAEA